MRKITTAILIPLILFIAGFFRFYNLGYSNFQGDEIKAQSFLLNEQNFYEYLLTNTKGPGQYLVTKLIYLTNLNTFFDIEFLLRLPFALASFITVVLIYFVVKNTWNKKTAVLTTLLVSLSGLLLAFGRLVQYQAFIMLFGVIAVLTIIKYLQKENSKGNIWLLISGISSAIGLLFHYDALSYIVPISLFLIFKLNRKFKIFYYLLPITSTGLFFIPYVLNENFGYTFYYLYRNRTFSYFSYDSIFYSLKLLRIYHPLEFIILIATGSIVWLFRKSKDFGWTYLLITISVISLITVRYFHETPRRLFIYPSTFLLGILMLKNLWDHKAKTTKSILLIETWALFTFMVYGLFINKPLTHIYNFLLPLIIIAAVELSKLPKKLLLIVLTIVTIGTISFNYQAYIENKIEYPWQNESYIYGQMYTPIPNGEKVHGIFGFPYSRNLNNLYLDLNYYSKIHNTKNIISNEKIDRIKFYLSGYNGSDSSPYFYIEVKNAWDGETNEALVNKELIIEKTNYNLYLVN